MILPQGIPGRAGDAREGEVCGIQWYIVRYQQPISFGQIGVGMAGVLRRGGFGGQVQHTVIQQTGLFSHMTVRENIEIIPRLSKADPERTRTRTLELMDTANRTGGLVVGTGDLSELALGWATYNGDHMSMYGVNAGVPKTLVRHLVRYEADIAATPALKEVLLDILDTPVSPELLPAKDNGEIAQRTEDLVGPYELHDFYLYYVLRFGFGPAKIFRLARAAFAGREEYPDAVLYKWLRNFYWRFFAQQFKRSCLPDGPKIGSVTLSPRGDWRMPSDACAALWLAELEQLFPQKDA